MSTNYSTTGVCRINRRCFYAKVLLTGIIILALQVVTYGQQFNWSWASQIHGTHQDAINRVHSNIKGEILVTGTFFSSAIDWEDTILVNPYENLFNGIYLGKLNTHGELLWANKIFCAPGDFRSSVTFTGAGLNPFGESFVTGKVSKNGIIIDSIIFPAPEGLDTDGFVARFDTNGKVKWAHVYEDGCEVTSVVADPFGGFYVVGKIYPYCEKIDFGGLTLFNFLNENLSFIAHYNNYNNIDWAKLVDGKLEYFNGRLAANGDLLISGEYQYNGHENTLTIDDFTLTCPSLDYGCTFWGQLTQDGDVKWLYNIAEQDIISVSRYNTQVGYQQRIVFIDPFIIVQGDTIYANSDIYRSSVLADFDLNGVFQGAKNIPPTFGGMYYSLYKSPADKWFASLSLVDTVTCDEEVLFNISTATDPLIMELDSAFNSIGCYQQELNYLSYAPGIDWDRYGNMLKVGNFSGDSISIGGEILTNYQFHEQLDYYIAYSNDCDTMLSQLILEDNLLKAPTGLSWKWYFNNSEISQAIEQSIMPSQTGYYTASASQPDGCVKWTQPYHFVNENKNLINSVFIYPNPSTGEISVKTPQGFSYFRIYDLTGSVIYSCEPTDELKLDFSYLPSGTYYVKAGNAAIVYTTKFVLL